MNHQQPQPEIYEAKMIKRRPYFAFSLCLVLIGIAALFLFWPVGLIIIILGCLLDSIKYLCGNCGNKLEKTSRICPVCRFSIR